MSAPSPLQWRVWAKDPCTLQVLATMRAAVLVRRGQSAQAVERGAMLQAAEAEAEAKAIDDLVGALEKLGAATGRGGKAAA